MNFRIIEAYIKTQGVTKHQFAEECGILFNDLNDCIKRNKPKNKETLVMICKRMHVHANFFLTPKDIKDDNKREREKVFNIDSKLINLVINTDYNNNEKMEICKNCINSINDLSILDELLKIIKSLKKGITTNPIKN